MVKVFCDNLKWWWAPILIGVFSIAVGVYCLFTPLVALETFYLAFASLFTIKGVIEIFFCINNRKEIHHWGLSFFLGTLDLLIGLILCFFPISGIITLVYLIALWFLVQSIWSIGISIDLMTHKIQGAGISLVASLIMLLFGLIMIIYPIFTVEFIVYFIAFTCIFFGISRISIGVKLRELAK